MLPEKVLHQLAMCHLIESPFHILIDPQQSHVQQYRYLAIIMVCIPRIIFTVYGRQRTTQSILHGTNVFLCTQWGGGGGGGKIVNYILKFSNLTPPIKVISWNFAKSGQLCLCFLSAVMVLSIMLPFVLSIWTKLGAKVWKADAISYLPSQPTFLRKFVSQ